MTHTLTYRLLNHDLKDPVRSVEVHATPEEIRSFAEVGYLVRERLFQGELLERLRAALDEVAAAESRSMAGMGEGMSTSRRFGGLFLRHLMDKQPAFLDLLKFPPLLSVARALLGPQVQVRGLSARISYPEQPNQETHWHFHQRLVPDPLPPFFSRPQTIDALIYLDDVTEANGPLCVVPGSHQRLNEDLPGDHYDDLPGQIVLRVPAGSCVMCHGSLWHRALPNRPEGTVRRLLLLGYGPTWMKSSIYGDKPQDGLTAALLKDADEETRELLGVAGYM